MESIKIPVNLYSVSQAITFLKGLDITMSGTWLRKRMRDEKLEIYKVGNSEFVMETDLYKLSRLPKVNPGPKRKARRQK